MNQKPFVGSAPPGPAVELTAFPRLPMTRSGEGKPLEQRRDTKRWDEKERQRKGKGGKRKKKKGE